MTDEEFVPYVPAEKSMPELTIKAMILGALLSVILGMANEYTGLYVGMTVCASIPAAVISLAIFKALKGNILENNMVQTAASAGESLAAGVIFTTTALIITNSTFPTPIYETLPYLEWTVLILVGGILGIFLTIFLRYALVVEEKLPYPEGTACAETLKAGHKGGKAFKYLMSGLGIGAAVKALVGIGGLSLWKFDAPGILKFPLMNWKGKPLSGALYSNFACEPLLLGVGYIVGFKIASWMFAGSILAFWVLTPAMAALVVPTTSLDTASFIGIWNSYVRPIAIGAMLVGGIWTMISMRGAILTSIRRARGARGAKLKNIPRTARDLPLKLGIIVVGALCIPAFVIYYTLSNAGLGIIALVLALIFAFLFSSVSAYIVGLVGSSNNPASGMTLATLFVSCIVLAALGVTGEEGIILAIGIITVACCALAISGDQMQDLKTGYMLGATPRNQQIMQIIGVMAMAVIAIPLLGVLDDAYGIGTGLPAFQGDMMRSTASAFFETGAPWILYVIGGALAVALILFGLPVLPIAVGIYLPFYLMVGIFLGGIVRWITDKIMVKHSEEEKAEAENNGIIASSGLVAGSALAGIVLAFVIIGTGRGNGLLELSGLSFTKYFSMAEAPGAVLPCFWPTLLVLALVALFIIYVAVGGFAKSKKA